MNFHTQKVITLNYSRGAEQISDEGHRIRAQKGW
jgi:hypothetical protein